MKRLIIIAFMTMTVVAAGAQTKIGIRGGLNSVYNDVSDVSGETVLCEEYYNGFYIGGVLHSHYKSGLGFEIGAYYAQDGLKLPDEETFKLNSIMVPISLKMFMGLTNTIDLFVYAGPQLQLNVGDLGATVLNGQFTQEYVFDTANYSVNVGAGIQLSENLLVSVNYNWLIQDRGLYSYSQDNGVTTVTWGENPMGSRTLHVDLTILF